MKGLFGGTEKKIPRKEEERKQSRVEAGLWIKEKKSKQSSKKQ